MDRLQRIYRLHRLLLGRRVPISHSALCEALECSRASVNRIIQEMRLHLNAPIEYDRASNGYFYAKTERPYELPGVWFSAPELHALLVAQHYLSRVQPGLLEGQLAPLKTRIEKLLQQAGSEDLTRRIRIIAIGNRSTPPRWFEKSASALFQRRVMRIEYKARSSDRVSVRDISPQRLIHYRDNWYLDAWCHSANALRSFSLDRIVEAEVTEMPAREIADDELERHFAGGYGIFAGEAGEVAVLRFLPERARWVAEEQWHPQQQSRFLDDGRYELSVPYSDPRELVMDILKYGADVEVVGPVELREGVKKLLEQAASQYQRGEAQAQVLSLPKTTMPTR